MPGPPLLAVPDFLATTALAAPTTWHIADLTSTATGARAVHVGLSTDPYQGGRETFALATLDGDGPHTVDLDWPTTLGTTLTGSLHLTVATSPAPAQDLEILFEDGTTLMVHLPSTEHTAHGALFFVDPDPPIGRDTRPPPPSSPPDGRRGALGRAPKNDRAFKAEFPPCQGSTAASFAHPP